MAKKKKSKTKSKSTRKKTPAMAGYDFGLPHRTMVMPAIDFVQNFQEAGIVGCGHLEVPDQEFGPIPAVAFIAKRPDKLELALRQLESWADFTGSDAVDVRITFVGDGYEVSVGPSFEHLMWRTVGLGTFSDYQAGAIRFIKRIDTRHPNVERLAEYSERTVAPVCFTGLAYTGTEDSPRFADNRSVSFAPNMPRIKLLHIPVYRTADELPMEMRKPSKEELEASRKEYASATNSAAAYHSARERRLKSVAPATMHMLQHSQDVIKMVEELAAEGLEPWQIEQACVNHQIWEKASPSTRYKLRKQDAVASIVAEYVEIDTPTAASILASQGDIKAQAVRDLRALLEGLGQSKLPEDLEKLQALLAKLGHRKASET